MRMLISYFVHHAHVHIRNENASFGVMYGNSKIVHK